MKAFYADLRAFQQKYPMVYIEAWTPEDFHHAAKEKPRKVDWNDPDHVATASILSDRFDANEGTNWDRLHEAISAPV